MVYSPWLGNEHPTCCMEWPKIRKIKKQVGCKGQGCYPPEVLSFHLRKKSFTEALQEIFPEILPRTEPYAYLYSQSLGKI